MQSALGTDHLGDFPPNTPGGRFSKYPVAPSKSPPRSRSHSPELRYFSTAERMDSFSILSDLALLVSGPLDEGDYSRHACRSPYSSQSARDENGVETEMNQFAECEVHVVRIRVDTDKARRKSNYAGDKSTRAVLTTRSTHQFMSSFTHSR